MRLVMETMPWLRSFFASGGGTSDKARRERGPRAYEPLFVWPAAAVIQNPFGGRIHCLRHALFSKRARSPKHWKGLPVNLAAIRMQRTSPPGGAAGY